MLVSFVSSEVADLIEREKKRGGVPSRSLACQIRCHMKRFEAGEGAVFFPSIDCLMSRSISLGRTHVAPPMLSVSTKTVDEEFN